MCCVEAITIPCSNAKHGFEKFSLYDDGDEESLDMKKEKWEWDMMTMPEADEVESAFNGNSNNNE